MTGTIQFFRDAKKTRKLFLYACSISILLAFVLIYCLGIFDDIVKMKPAIFAGGALLVMLYLTINSLMGIKDKSPLIHLDGTGFYGKTTPLSKSFGRVEWIDVIDIRFQRTGGDLLVITRVGNTEKYQGRLSKLMWNMAYNKQDSKLELMYSTSEIGIEAQELFDLFMSYWKYSK